MRVDIGDLLLCLGLVIVMVLYWTFYILCVRRIPESEEWYDSSDSVGSVSDGPLFYYPYGTLILGMGGFAGLVDMANPPEFVETVLQFLLVTAFVIGIIGFTGGLGIPLPWPFVPRWVVDIRKAKRARRREHRQARKMKKKE